MLLFFSPVVAQRSRCGCVMVAVMVVNGWQWVAQVVVVVRRSFVLRLNQEMFWPRRHQSLVLDHCKNEHRHKYEITQIPGSLHLRWARGEEDSGSSWRCRSVATVKMTLSNKILLWTRISLGGLYFSGSRYFISQCNAHCRCFLSCLCCPFPKVAM